MLKKILNTIAIALLLINGATAQDKIKRIKAFAKAYGYVKYFHPSTENTLVDWDNFAAYGVEEILKCSNNEEARHTLSELFAPIGPTIRFSSDSVGFDISRITPEQGASYLPTYWQHAGVSKGMTNGPYQSYKSVLVNHYEEIDDTTHVLHESIFTEYPEIGEVISKPIAANIYCQIPLVLYTRDGRTYPKSHNLEKLEAAIAQTDTSLTSLAIRLGNVVNIYNVIQHFYPYFDEVDVDWDAQLEMALQRSFSDTGADDHVVTLQKLTATIKDGHLWVWQGPSAYGFYPDVHWEWIQDSLVITKVMNDTVDIQVGDVVTKINNQEPHKYFEEVNSRISYGTKTYLNYSNKARSLSAKKDAPLLLEINNQEISLRHHRSISQYTLARPSIQANMYKLLDGDVMYISLATIRRDTLTKLLPELTKMKGLVCDFRGHNYHIWDFFKHFLQDEVTGASIVKIPRVIYPDQERPVGFEESQYPSEPQSPYLGDIKTVFIIDGRVKSSAESFMNSIKRHGLGTIVGEQSAGANGMMNPFQISGEVSIYWTGAKVTNDDGSQFHGIGITPDIEVHKTIQGIRDGKDEFLDKAIEILRGY